MEARHEGRRTNLKRLGHFLERSTREKPPTEEGTGVKQLSFSRKERRKVERKLKKARKNAFVRKAELPTLDGQLAVRQKAYEDKLKRAEKLKAKRAKMLEKRRQKEEQEREEEAKKRAFVEAQRDDEREIKRMEKLLHMNKRRNKSTLPPIFVAEGLDYILDAIDSKKSHVSADAESDADPDAPDDVDEDTAGYDDDDTGAAEMPMDTEEGLDCTEKTSVVCSSHEDASDQLDDDVDDGADNAASSGSDHVDSEEDIGSDQVSSHVYDDGDREDSDVAGEHPLDEATDGLNESPAVAYHEDIYGRLRDAQGNIVEQPANIGKVSASSAYIPPAKRLELAAASTSRSSGQKKLELTRLVKQLKGLLNRLSEGNMQAICSQIENIYGHHSRADVTAGLASLVNDACLGELRTPERLSTEMAMMVAILHNNVGNEVGAEFVEMLARRYSELLEQGRSESKEIDNILTFLCSLYNFQVIHGGLLIDVINRLVEHFDEKTIELILLTLKGCGFSLRKDEPAALKELLKTVNTKASMVDTSGFEDRTRISFMLEVLAAIRNNNIRKIPNYDPSVIEHQRKLLRNFVRTGSLADEQLRVSLADLLDAGARGKWWLVGSAWHGSNPDAAHGAGRDSDSTRVSAALATPATTDTRILELARKQRMNTDVRRSIFCIIMTSEDYVDAYEKLLKLGLKNQPERELVHVVVDCCMQEKTYNGFYSHLMQKFLELDRRFQMTFQFNLWDKFKILNDASNFSITNLASMVVHLLSEQALSLSALKAIEFGAMDKGTLRFMKAVLTGLLGKDDATVKSTFSRIAGFPKLKLLREGLKIFMQHFLLRSTSKSPVANKSTSLEAKVAIAEIALVSSADALYL